MKNLSEYINEAYDKEIKLPYTFDIYNEGEKNKDFKITKSNIYHLYFKLESNVDKSLDSSIRLPLVAEEIRYAEPLDEETTKNWTKVPRIRKDSYAGAWYSDKQTEYNYNKYNRDWNEWLRSLKPYMRGKISVTLDVEDGQLFIKVNDDKFNKQREEKIKNLSDIEKVKKYGEEMTAQEKQRIKELEIERIKQEKELKAYNDFLNSMSDKERDAYLRQQDRAREYSPRSWRGHWTGD